MPPPPPGAVLRGVLEIEGAGTVGAVTRLAVAEALASVARQRGKASSIPPSGQEEAPLRIEVTWSPPRAGARSDVLTFAYAVGFGDVGSAADAQAQLEKEAATGGTRRLLPHFAKALGLRGESVASQMRIVQWTFGARASAGHLRRGKCSAADSFDPSVSSWALTDCRDPAAVKTLPSEVSLPIDVPDVDREVPQDSAKAIHVQVSSFPGLPTSLPAAAAAAGLVC
eukprot:gnl/TRDRNA2_/TRDRNA2_201878_c0_seq1.p1 gnl/TRDRNA2_/TRDRNA2_201878_c0~~gnl/TRDRNA2_/TRDRNA2_201878_c0_seq1.p1  ORF type:complete len:252 (-),score=38.28 gnl/TRDRNA2_/TRDRNA2_201878_c0_seq1:176-853(-)